MGSILSARGDDSQPARLPTSLISVPRTLTPDPCALAHLQALRRRRERPGAPSAHVPQAAAEGRGKPAEEPGPADPAEAWRVALDQGEPLHLLGRRAAHVRAPEARAVHACVGPGSDSAHARAVAPHPCQTCLNNQQPKHCCSYCHAPHASSPRRCVATLPRASPASPSTDPLGYHHL